MPGDKKPSPPQRQQQPGKEQEMKPRPQSGEFEYGGSGKLSGKCALITGGDSGIGRAIAIAFAREGADVAFAYLEEDKDARKTREIVEQAGVRCLALRGDVGQEVCRDVVEKTVSAFGRLDILVNNAAGQGFPYRKPPNTSWESAAWCPPASWHCSRLSTPKRRYRVFDPQLPEAGRDKLPRTR